MMLRKISCLTVLVLLAASLTAQTPDNVNPDALIDVILDVEAKQAENIKDVTFETEYLEGEMTDDGFKEKERFLKKTYIKYLKDTVLFAEEYLEYYKDGKLQEPEKRDKEAVKRVEKKKKRKSYDISYSMLKPFHPEYRPLYDIEYVGLTEEEIEGYICHHFRVEAKEEVDTLINGDYYFEAASFNLVRVDFSPAKLVKKAMFRLNDLSMSIVYGPTEEGWWLPRQFNISGKGRAAFFFGVKFAGVEYYRNPVINSGLSNDLFKVDENEQ